MFVTMMVAAATSVQMLHSIVIGSTFKYTSPPKTPPPPPPPTTTTVPEHAPASNKPPRKIRAGFVGLGAMGYEIAKHVNASPLLIAPCKVWNRTPQVAIDHSNTFGTVAVTNVTDMADCDVIFSCVSTTQVLDTVIQQIESKLRPGTIWIDCTSGEPNEHRAIADRLASLDVGMVDAPVSGGPAGAKAGTLSVIVGATPSTFDRVEGIIGSFAKQVKHVGPIGAGHAIKSMNNTLNVAHLMLASEALVALTKMGIDPAGALEAINASSGRSLQTEVRLPTQVLTRQFNYGFKLGLMKKDVGIANSLLDNNFDGARLMRLCRDMVVEAEAEYGCDADYTCVTKTIETRAGCEISTESSYKHKSKY